MKIGMNKTENVTHAINTIRKTVANDKPKLVALPECFNSPYGTKYFNEYAEQIPNGYTSDALSNIAKELQIYLIGGTIPERDNNDNKLYNTCTVWSPTGDLIAKYRKVSERILLTFLLKSSKKSHPTKYYFSLIFFFVFSRCIYLTSMSKVAFALKSPTY